MPVSLLKELIQIQVIVMLLFKLMKSKLDSLDVFFLIFLIYFLFHLVTLTDAKLWVDGVRYQLGYITIGILLIINRVYIIKLDKVAYYIFIMAVPVVVIAIVEFFDSGIIEVIYGQSKSLLNHTELALGERLISTFGNPINLGVFLTISYVSAFYMYKERKINVFVFSLFSISVCFVIFFTFSRIAIISFFIVSCYFFLIGSSMFKKVALSLFVFLFLYFFSFEYTMISYLNDFNTDLMFERFLNISNSDTYVENARVRNWSVALQNIDTLLFSIWGLGVGFINPTVEEGGIIVENMFISVLIEYGAVGLLFYIFYFIYLIKIGSKLKGGDKYFSIGFLIVFLICGMGNDLNRNFPFVFYFWTISAAIILKYKKEMYCE